MIIVEQSHKILYPATWQEWGNELRLVELAGRTAYQSFDKMKDGSNKKFITMLLSHDPPHTAALEFGRIVVQFTTDRGISHALVRHRHCNFLQESTIFCNYAADKFENEVRFIKPVEIPEDENNDAYCMWKASCRDAEIRYFNLLKEGCKPKTARAVLPMCVKTSLVIATNFTQWRHIFKVRLHGSGDADNMKALLQPLYNEVCATVPEVFK